MAGHFSFGGCIIVLPALSITGLSLIPGQHLAVKALEAATLAHVH
jgi:hypothetical protein